MGNTPPQYNPSAAIDYQMKQECLQCNSDYGPVDPICACINSPLRALGDAVAPPSCFDTGCQANGYTTATMTAIANACPTYIDCRAIINANDQAALSNVKVQQMCSAQIAAANAPAASNPSSGASSSGGTPVIPGSVPTVPPPQTPTAGILSSSNTSYTPTSTTISNNASTGNTNASTASSRVISPSVNSSSPASSPATSSSLSSTNIILLFALIIIAAIIYRWWAGNKSRELANLRQGAAEIESRGNALIQNAEARMTAERVSGAAQIQNDLREQIRGMGRVGSS